MTDAFDPDFLERLIAEGSAASAVAYFHAHAGDVARLAKVGAEASETWSRLREELTLCHAHRFDLEYGPEKAAECLSRLGVDEEPKGGPDNFYNGVGFVRRRIAAVLSEVG